MFQIVGLFPGNGDNSESTDNDGDKELLLWKSGGVAEECDILCMP